VAPAAPAQIVVDPSSASSALSIAVLDVYGNVETSFAGSVTIKLGSGAGPSGLNRHAKLSATASDGVVTFTHVKPGDTARSRVLQATADGITASTVLTKSDRNASRSAHDQARTDHVGAKPAAHRATRRTHVQ
jgi:hypothetical protein